MDAHTIPTNAGIGGNYLKLANNGAAGDPHEGRATLVYVDNTGVEHPLGEFVFRSGSGKYEFARYRSLPVAVGNVFALNGDGQVKDWDADNA